MKSYKKLLITLLLIFASIFSVGFSSPKVLAEQENKVKTQMFLPSTYFEYFKLSSPVDICADENFVYIAEKTAIVVFNRQTESYTRIDCQALKPSIEWNITKIDCYNGHVFFLNQSKVCYISLSQPQQIVDCNLYSSLYFHISGNRIYTHTNSHILSWTISYSEGVFTFGSYDASEGEYLPNITYGDSSSSVAFVYSPVSSYLYYFTSSDCSKVSTDNFSPNIFAHSTQYSTFYNGNVYFIENNCLYEYNESLSTQPNKLFDLNQNQNDLKGFCIQEGKVLLVNNSKNEIWEYDLTSASFTDTFVATYKVAQNRLTAEVVDITISGDYAYTLQKQSLSRFALDGSTCQTISFPEGFTLSEFSPQFLAVLENKLIISNGNQVKAFGICEGENLSATELTFNSLGTWEENNICGIYAFDGEFYLLKNRIIENIAYAVIYKLTATANGFEVNNDQLVWKKEGTGINFTINSFGELYLLANQNNIGNRITCYDLINKTTSELSTPIADGVKKLVSDFENVYVLNESTIYNVTCDTTFTIEKSANFNEIEKPVIQNPVSLTVDLSTGKTYLLYKGYILESSSLPLKTPNTYSVPSEYNGFEDTPQIVTVSSGAKLFTVAKEGDLFKYDSVVSAISGEYLLICNLSDDFCLIGYEEHTYLARIQDLTEQTLSTFTPDFSHGYYVTKAGKYAQPMLNLTFKLEDINAYEKVSVLGGITVNQVEFYKVCFTNGTKGYIQKSFVVEFISEEATKESFYLAECKKTEVYSADGTTQIGNLEKGTIKVYGQENGLFKISFNDGVGYIKSSAIIQPKNNALRNTLVVMLVATSFTITAIYLLVRYNRKFNI